jgi:hypothetical protein
VTGAASAKAPPRAARLPAARIHSRTFNYHGFRHRR